MSEQRKRGRPERKIDKGLFDQLCATCNSLSELSRELNVSEKTLRKWISENYSNDFAKLFRERRRKGRLKVKEKDLSLSETTASADDVRKDLMHQLTKRKALSPVFMDLINDYKATNLLVYQHHLRLLLEYQHLRIEPRNRSFLQSFELCRLPNVGSTIPSNQFQNKP